MRHTALAITLGLLLVPATTRALPVLSVDMDPSTPGVQDTLSLSAPTAFDVDLVISGVEAGQPLNGFELDLDFDPGVLAAVSVVDGGFLLGPVFQVQQGIAAGSIEWAAVTLAPIGAVGDGVLARIRFQALALGSSTLDLNDVLLSAPFGIEIPVAAVRDGLVTVSSRPDPPPAIPEPSSALLFLGGGALVARRTWHCHARNGPRSSGRAK